MFPEVFPYLANDSDVVGFIGTNPVRCYDYDDAPQRVASPYVVWLVVSTNPENHLDGTPPVDEQTVRLDCWSDDAAEAQELATAVRNAIELDHHMIAADNGRDPETKRYRVSLTFTFWTDR
jgi:hypothetical protein